MLGVNCINVHCDAEIRGYCLFLLITTGLFPIKVLLTLFCIRLEDVSLYLDSLLSDFLICYHICCWLLLLVICSCDSIKISCDSINNSQCVFPFEFFPQIWSLLWLVQRYIFFQPHKRLHMFILEFLYACMGSWVCSV